MPPYGRVHAHPSQFYVIVKNVRLAHVFHNHIKHVERRRRVASGAAGAKSIAFRHTLNILVRQVLHAHLPHQYMEEI
ncbi:hypothetical protein KSZ_35730 [Dictyobacter formicarum]|uniref:Uncharacterized protein n=1 Tax=Dictyobacter formicarum TaxID=2778368 RepID=A0ABQ3VI32_9CHLR|nr:hypothetical protein KSZ_35730 [Dictyobacter formicarum]